MIVLDGTEDTQVRIIDGQLQKDGSCAVVDPVFSVQFIDVVMDALETPLSKLADESTGRVAGEPPAVLCLLVV